MRDDISNSEEWQDGVMLSNKKFIWVERGLSWRFWSRNLPIGLGNFEWSPDVSGCMYVSHGSW